MASYEFHATHGVRFPVTGERFEHAPDLAAPDGSKRYRCVVTDAAAARRLRALAKSGEYGITEVKSPGEHGNDDG